MDQHIPISEICEWARSWPSIIRLYVFGSRARSDFTRRSDLDLAIEIEKGSGDETTMATWIYEKPKHAASLEALVQYKLHLQHLNGENTPTVEAAVQDHGVLIYARNDCDA